MDAASGGTYQTPMTGSPPAPAMRHTEGGKHTGLWIGLGIAAVVLVIAAIAGGVWFFNANAQMPSVVGMAPDQAQAVLKTAGFNVGPLAYSPTVDPSVAKGMIVSMEPASGAWAAKGSAVTLTVNGPHMLPVPAVAGMSEADAIARLGSAEFKVGPVKQEYSATVPTGKVIAVVPAAGVSVAAESPVTLTVSKGVQIVLVPNAYNRDQYAAITALHDAGLKYHTVRVYDDQIQPGNVISQSPAAGVKTQAGTVVTLTISKGAKPIPTAGVPSVVGDTETIAVSRLQAAGFVPKIKMAPVLPQDAGLVIDQDPVEGKPQPKGSAVTIWVGQVQP